MHLRALIFSFVVCTLIASLYGVPGAHATVETFVTPGLDTWTVPSGVTSVTVQVWGGGAGGGGTLGGGGGGGAYSTSTVAVTPAEDIDITVGSGGIDDTNGG
ncbi:MAG: glycine-rich domain-containing protein, partial [Patescibacteria group bacterium]